MKLQIDLTKIKIALYSEKEIKELYEKEKRRRLRNLKDDMRHE